MGKTVTLTMDESLYEKVRQHAAMDNRSLANFIKMAMARYIEERNLVDDFEMEEIKNNTNLIERIQAGSRDAADRKGHFVD